jgi:hypothetical protein
MNELVIEKIWFDGDFIYGLGDDGKVYRQSLLWYKRLRTATDEQRAEYEFGMDGIHWRNLDEDVSFESFQFENAEPTALQRFFLLHPEIKVAELARQIGINPTLLADYIHDFKQPSREREQLILNHIHELGAAYSAVQF